MTDEKRRFHRLFRASAVLVALVPLACTPADAQRVWGGAQTIVVGPAAAAGMYSEGPPDPLNPASNAHAGRAAEASLAFPMGIHELAVHRFAVRMPVRGTSLSAMIGRLGFDRLVQYRLSAGLAGTVAGATTDGSKNVSLGIRAGLDRFSSSGIRQAYEPSLTAGVLVGLPGTGRAGLVTDWRDAGVHGARSIAVTAGMSFDLGRRMRSGIGWTHETAHRAEFSSALLFLSDWGGFIMAGIGSGEAGPGVTAGVLIGDVRMEFAWLRASPAGATRFVAASLLDSGKGND